MMNSEMKFGRRGFADLNCALATAERSDDMQKKLPEPNTIRNLLRYEADAGLLFWKPRGRNFFKSDRDHKIWNTRYAGKEAFSYVCRFGYKKGAIFGNTFQAHRIAWILHFGEEPKLFLDHIDGDRSNNKISNLREATRSQNQSNRKPNKNSKSKYLGVFMGRKSWFSRIEKNGKSVYLGQFSLEEDAASAYDMAAILVHGSFARLNFPENKQAYASEQGVTLEHVAPKHMEAVR
jgi:hypothetical protein